MTQYIKAQQVLEDTWTHLEAEAPLPEDISLPVTVPLSRYLTERDALRQRTGELGVLVQGEDDVRDLSSDDLEALALVLIDFPHFKDGRGYSHAHILRTQLGYAGPLRAVGDVLVDQLFYMKRCGIDEFALRPDKSFEHALAALEGFSVVYQAAADDQQTILENRHTH